MLLDKKPKNYSEIRYNDAVLPSSTILEFLTVLSFVVCQLAPVVCFWLKNKQLVPSVCIL